MPFMAVFASEISGLNIVQQFVIAFSFSLKKIPYMFLIKEKIYHDFLLKLRILLFFSILRLRRSIIYIYEIFTFIFECNRSNLVTERLCHEEKFRILILNDIETISILA